MSLTEFSEIKNKKIKRMLLLFIFVALGFILRFYGVFDSGLMVDEFTEVYATRGNDLKCELNIYHVYRPDHPPFFFLIRYFWATCVGNDLVSARMFGILNGTIAIVLVYFLTKYMWGRNVGLLTACLFSISPCFILQAQMARCYPFFQTLLLLSFYFFIRAHYENKFTWWMINIAINIVIVYTHLFGIICIAIQGLVLLICSYRKIKFIVFWATFQSFFILLLMAYMLYFSPRDPGDVNGSALLKPLIFFMILFNSDLAVWRTGQFFIGLYQDSYLDFASKVFCIGSILGLTVIYISSILYFIFNIFYRKNREFSVANKIIILCTLFPLPFIYTLCLTWRNCLAPRFIWPYSTLGLLIMTAFMIINLKKISLKIFCLGVIICAYGYQLMMYYPGPSGDGALAAGRIIKNNYKPGDTVLIMQGIQEFEQFRYEMKVPDIPIKPVYATADICYTIWEESLCEKNQSFAGTNNGAFWVVGFPNQHEGFNIQLFEEFLDYCGMTYSSQYFYGDLQSLVYTINKKNITVNVSEKIQTLFPVSANMRYLLNFVGLENLDKSSAQNESIALHRTMEIPALLMHDSEFVLPLFIGFPLLERGAAEFVALLASRILEKHPNSALTHILAATTHFERNKEEDGLNELRIALSKNRGASNRYALLFLPLVEDIYVHKNRISALKNVAALEEKGVLFPNILRVRAESL